MRTLFLAAAGVAFSVSAVLAEPPGNPAVASDADGKYSDADGNPTFKIQPDGTVDWFTYSGFRRYHSECHVCHGPDGEGSSYAPALAKSLKVMDYAAFTEIVVNGRKVESASQHSVMPAFGLNRNVMCYLDDIYVYLRARAQGDLPRGRPAKREDKTDATKQAESACLGS